MNTQSTNSIYAKMGVNIILYLEENAMNLKLKVNSARGDLVVYEECVALELGSVEKRIIPSGQISGIELKVTMSPTNFIFKFPGMATIRIHGTGKTMIEAPMVKLPDAKKVEELVLLMISKK